MLYELRHYKTTLPGAESFQASFGADLVPVLRDNGFNLTGAWNVLIGEGSRADLLWMLRWPSLADREKAFAAIHADPRNAAFRDANLKHLVSTTSTLLAPTPFSPLP